MCALILGLDHVVVLVEDLPTAVAGYEDLGFRVTPGGEHADGLTHNALVPFGDGTYLELVAFSDPLDETDNVWGWRPLARSGGGPVDYCALSDGLATDARRLRGSGFEVDGLHSGGRRLPDGTEARWEIARIRQEGRLLPFLIEDCTPRTRRVPSGPAAEHPNGATGISRLLVAAPKGQARAHGNLTTLAGARLGDGVAVALGPQEVLVLPVALDPPRDHGGPLAPVAAAGGMRAELDRSLTQGVRILANWT